MSNAAAGAPTASSAKAFIYPMSAITALGGFLFGAEVFPTAIRGKPGSLGTISHWGLDLVISAERPAAQARCCPNQSSTRA